MASPADRTLGLDLAALEAITEAIESGAGLPEVVRAAARTLEASLVLLDRTGAVLAVAARSPADERSLLDSAQGVETIELRVADAPVGRLRMRARGEPGPALVRLVTTLVASELERVRAPARASQEASTAFLHAVLDRELDDAEAIVARARDLGVDVTAGASVLVARARAHGPTDEGWRARVLASAERGARAVVPTAIAAPPRHESGAAEAVVLVAGGDDALARRAAEGVLRELQESLPGQSLAVGRSRVAIDPLDLHRAGNEALLAVNVAQGGEDQPLLAFEQTGAYRLLLSAMSEDPGELQRFYAETVEPLVAYDRQYETELVRTVEAFLDNDGNVAGTAQKLFTHRHTIRYRLERVRELSGLDVGSTDGREKLSLGLKAMRVLGVAAPGGPATEPGAGAGRVPRR
ncbi:MAG TPA: helix-turn-helix domain-containing protein [Solirubrobacteraceae bacterium]|jgi:sugar diacid utilization regulator|nr:helix-turn-helix domain-containing protein [Solirubrobacteraceae bacterium]